MVFISTYIPRRCGIASYTKDLTNEINILNPYHFCDLMALDDPEKESVDYPWEVKFRINRNMEEDYIKAADYLNKSSTNIVCLQHEYGIFGGDNGDYILTLVRKLNKPLVTTFHTVLDDPTPHQKYIVQKLAQYSKVCTVMIDQAAIRLKEKYDIPADKILVIYHGVPNIKFIPSEFSKRKLGFNTKDFLLGSINLISSNKGLEYIIKALPKIKKTIPNVKFLMMGQTHPLFNIWEKQTFYKSRYRPYLHQLAKKLALTRNVIEINRYLPLEELIAYLQAMDVYITPYVNLSQTASGTLAYAIGAGKVCISTPYIYAKEVLANNRGLFCQVKDANSLADMVIKVYNDRLLRQKLEKNAYSYGRKMIWSRIALKHLYLFKYLLLHG